MNDARPTAPTLAVSVVTFRPDLARLEASLHSLANAIALAREQQAVSEVALWLVDNTPDADYIDAIRTCAGRVFVHAAITLNVRHGHGNVGYGRAHNLALAQGDGEFRLILNPDVELHADALGQALAFMRAHPRVGLLAPAAFDERGARQYLCKRYPALVDLLLRGFAPAWLKRPFDARLARYEMRDVTGDDVVEGVPITSGAFMLVRDAILAQAGGFDPRFFLYFEDFDWSLRLGRIAGNAYVPAVRVVHHGGNAAKKGVRHVGLFIAGAWRFYRKHGWKWR